MSRSAGLHTRAIACLLFALMSACGNTGKGPRDYYVSQADLALEIPDVTRNSHRWYDTPREEELLRIAESVYPPRETVLAAARTARFGLQDEATGTDLWCYADFDGIKIPYAVTRSGVAYYLVLCAGAEKSDMKSVRDLDRDEHEISGPAWYFSYVAKIEEKERFRHPSTSTNGASEEFKNVYVAHLQLSWFHTGGADTLDSLQFERQRWVVLSRRGRVLAVYGDGPAMVGVS